MASTRHAIQLFFSTPPTAPLVRSDPTLRQDKVCELRNVTTDGDLDANKKWLMRVLFLLFGLTGQLDVEILSQENKV